MINNRQAGRRNRGRNNGRPNGGNRGGDNGNRIDNRARGNAPQLLEKYRNLARDAQLAGDRVNTEYYLQFADHYFRVIADNRARQDEQQSRFRRNDDNFDDEADQGYDARDESIDGEPGQGGRVDGRQGRDNRRERSRIQIRTDIEAGDDEQPVADEASSRRQGRRADKIVLAGAPSDEAGSVEAEEAEAAPKRAPRGRKPRQPRVEEPAADEAPGLDLAALPPAIVRADNDSGEDDGPEGEKPAPRRRGRRPKAPAEAAE